MTVLASLASLTGDPVLAARLLGATEAFRREAGIALPDAHGDASRAVRAALGPSAFAAARAKGAALTPEGAVAEALGKGRRHLRIVDPAMPEETAVDVSSERSRPF